MDASSRRLLWAITSIQYGHRSIADVVHLANCSVRLMQCGLGSFVLLVGKYLGISRRHILYGIALGFGLFTSTNMLMAMGMSHANLIHASAYWRTNLAACDLAALIWLGYTALGTTAVKIRLKAAKPIFRPLPISELSRVGAPNR